MATASDNFVNTKLSTYIDRLINKGNAYQFSFDDEGTEAGKLRQKIATNVYTSVVKNVENPTTDAMQQIGKQVDDWVSGLSNDVNKEKLGGSGSSNTPLWDGSDAGAKNIQFTVSIYAH